MGCAAFTFLSAYVAYTNKSNVWFVGASAIIAGTFLLVASYATWKEEHDKLEAATLRPRIRGFFTNLYPVGNDKGFSLNRSVCNHSQAPTNIRAVKVTLSEGDQEETKRAGLSPEGHAVRLEYGIEQKVHAVVNTENGLFITKLVVRLIDGFGNEYRIPFQGAPQPMGIDVEQASDRLEIIYTAR